MSGFVSWVLSILAVVIIGTILDMFLSEKKLGKTVRSVFASLTVLIIISPLPSLFNGCQGFEHGFSLQEITLDQKYLDFANSQKANALENGLAEALKTEGYSAIKVDITAEFSTQIVISLVRLDLSKMVIEKGVSNINKIENIRRLAAEYLMINGDMIIINE